MKPTNEDLAARVQQGDENAVALLIEQNMRFVFKTLRRLDLDDHDEDYLQIARLTLWRAAQLWNPNRGMYLTLAGLMLVQAISKEAAARQAMPRPSTLPDGLPDREQAPEIDREQRAKITEAIQWLKPAFRDIIQSVYLDDPPLGRKALAERLGINPAAANERRRAAIAALRRIVKHL